MAWKKLLDAVFEEEPAVSTVQQQAVQRPAPPVAWQGVAPVVVPSTDSQIYQTLAARTSIESLPEFSQLSNNIKALEAFIPDRVTRIKAAVAQARSNGLNIDELKRAIAGMRDKLSAEKKMFEQQLQEQSRTQCDERKASLDTIERNLAQRRMEVENLQKSRDQYKTELDIANQKLRQAANEFDSAYGRRAREIESQTSEYLALLT